MRFLMPGIRMDQHFSFPSSRSVQGVICSLIRLMVMALCHVILRTPYAWRSPGMICGWIIRQISQLNNSSQNKDLRDRREFLCISKVFLLWKTAPNRFKSRPIQIGKVPHLDRKHCPHLDWILHNMRQVDSKAIIPDCNQKLIPIFTSQLWIMIANNHFSPNQTGKRRRD